MLRHSYAFKQPHALLKRINAWALNDIGFDCAMVTACTAPSLPRKQKPLWSLLPDKHRDFFNKVTNRPPRHPRHPSRRQRLLPRP
ncbi:MAG: hypothetical protein KJO57_02105, partial [Deltaproteobacteria bacterium]|nr:hypothetical protein [Deltaproteobacteria bacterium]